ncbi:site-specific DNA-methyltransferase [Paenibacillus thiaminolyticus]|uniref:DNA-methyltransferase n=1 Tax=Paenibacillus thiaminolyticus TaxID=49283 RepID=UPI00116471D5|nr:site-specific DNA-methyltransferase [Paenibacillus thiaminolyticus]NGP58179.1 site-specific DNA-methyltransferase [Paenibacillus thiaminolyticus]
MENTIIHDDCLEAMRAMKSDSVDSIVTDPPYGLSKPPDIDEVLTKWLAGEDYEHRGNGFMGKTWDSFVPGPSIWREAYRVLKPGGYALVFAGTRTQDLMTISLRMAGFEVRDVIEWLYWSGFPKNMDVSKSFEGQWEGWGTALKPAHEPIILVRKPFNGTVASNLKKYNTGALNIDGCRIGRLAEDRTEYGVNGDEGTPTVNAYGAYNRTAYEPHAAGRFPANIVTVEHDGFWSMYCNVTPEVLCKKANKKDRNSTWDGREIEGVMQTTDDGRKKSIDNPFQRGETLRKNHHPTVKPTDLMAWLIRLITPPGGTALDPFAGSGSTLVAAKREGFNYIGIEREREYVDIALKRVD